jgi:hypothetical protein
MSSRAAERRRHKRQALACPVIVASPHGRVLGQTKAINLSDGGVYIPLPLDSVPTPSSRVKLVISVPRTTANTYMLEEFNCSARVLRHHPLLDEKLAGVALQFVESVQFGLEV